MYQKAIHFIVVVIHLRVIAYYLVILNVLNSYSFRATSSGTHCILFMKVTSLQRKHSLLCPVNDLKNKGVIRKWIFIRQTCHYANMMHPVVFRTTKRL